MMHWQLEFYNVFFSSVQFGFGSLEQSGVNFCFKTLP